MLLMMISQKKFSCGCRGRQSVIIPKNGWRADFVHDAWCASMETVIAPSIGRTRHVVHHAARVIKQSRDVSLSLLIIAALSLGLIQILFGLRVCVCVCVRPQEESNLPLVPAEDRLALTMVTLKPLTGVMPLTGKRYYKGKGSGSKDKLCPVRMRDVASWRSGEQD